MNLPKPTLFRRAGNALTSVDAFVKKHPKVVAATLLSFGLSAVGNPFLGVPIFFGAVVCGGISPSRSDHYPLASSKVFNKLLYGGAAVHLLCSLYGMNCPHDPLREGYIAMMPEYDKRSPVSGALLGPSYMVSSKIKALTYE